MISFAVKSKMQDQNVQSHKAAVSIIRTTKNE